MKIPVLLGWSIVSGAGVDLQWRQTAGGTQLHLDPPPTSVTNQVGGLVADHILVTKLDRDLLGNIGKFARVFDAEKPAPRDVRQLGKQIRPSCFLGSSSARRQ